MALANIRRAINAAHEALPVGDFAGVLVALEEIEEMVGQLEKRSNHG